jgi:predicted Zn-ribbon and HTH transcriptional regulator
MESMFPPATVRQRIIHLLTDGLHSSRELAELLAMPERQIEEHLGHVVRSLARDPARRFVLHPSVCRECGFLFRERMRLTRPSRCPRCRSEGISAPRYAIERRAASRHG